MLHGRIIVLFLLLQTTNLYVILMQMQVSAMGLFIHVHFHPLSIFYTYTRPSTLYNI